MIRAAVLLCALVAVLALGGNGSAVAAGPVATIVGPAATTTGTPVGFDGSRSSDADGDPLSFAWSIDGQDLGIDDAWLGVAFAHPGPHVIKLTVTDPAGDRDTASHTVSVTGVDRDPASLSPIGPAIAQGIVASQTLALRPASVRLWHHRLLVVLRCRGGGTCAGHLRAGVVRAAGRPPLVLAARTFRVRSGRPVTLGLALGRRARRHLHAATRVRVTAYRGPVRTANIWATFAYTVRVARGR